MVIQGRTTKALGVCVEVVREELQLDIQTPPPTTQETVLHSHAGNNVAVVLATLHFTVVVLLPLLVGRCPPAQEQQQ